MSSWDRFVRVYSGQTWDVPVECDDQITKGQRDKISLLGYYGQPILPIHAELLEQGIAFSAEHPYSISYRGCDDSFSRGFRSLEEARAYLEPRLQWANSNTQVGSDHATYSLIGFTLQDLGIDWTARRP